MFLCLPIRHGPYAVMGAAAAAAGGLFRRPGFAFGHSTSSDRRLQSLRNRFPLLLLTGILVMSELRPSTLVFVLFCSFAAAPTQDLVSVLRPLQGPLRLYR
jgi:hypothetical protein